RHGPWSGRVGGVVVDCAVVCAIGVGRADVYRGVRGWLDHRNGAGRNRREPPSTVVTEHRAPRLSRGSGAGESWECCRRTDDDVPDRPWRLTLLTSHRHLHRREIYVRHEDGYDILPSSWSIVREYSVRHAEHARLEVEGLGAKFRTLQPSDRLSCRAFR